MLRTGRGYKALSDDDWQKALNVNLLASVRLDPSISTRHDRTQIRRHSSHLLHPTPVFRSMTRRLLMLRRRKVL